MSETVTSLKASTMPYVSPFAQNMYLPNQAMDEVYIPSPALELATQAFLFQHQFASESPRTPRFMLIQGDMGTGKTSIAVRASMLMGTAILLLPPSAFASKHEDGGIDKITDAMQELERYSQAHRVHTALLADDIDHSNLSIDENTGKTTNPATIVGHLQAMSNNRKMHVGFTGLPIPILVTANSANKIAASLFRLQRARTYTHVMDEATKQEIARQLFGPATHAESTALARLFKTYRKENVAFWPALASDYRSKRIENAIRKNGFDRANMQKMLDARLPLDIALLTQLAEACRKTRPFDFLAKYRSAA